MGPTNNEASINRSTAECIGRTSSILDLKLAHRILPYARVIRSFCLPERGTPGVVRGLPMLPRTDRAAVFIGRWMQGRLGIVSAGTGSPTETGGVLASTSHRMASISTPLFGWEIPLGSNPDFIVRRMVAILGRL